MNKHKPKLLIVEKNNFSKENFNKLSKYFNVTLGCKSLKDNINNFSVIFVRLKNYLTDDLISINSKLQIICSPTTGVNHIKISNKRVKIISLRDCRNQMKEINSTCELTFGLLFSLLRKIPSAMKDVERKNWNRNKFSGSDIKNKIVGIIGFGRLGKASFKVLKSFGANIITYDKKHDTKKVFNKLISKSDIILIHMSYTEDNYHLFNKELFRKMKKNCILVNTARGELINQTDLIYALKNKIIGGAALDVIDNEYNLKTTSNVKLLEYLKKNENLIVTPHIGGMTLESLRKVETFIVDKLIERIINGKYKFRKTEV